MATNTYVALKTTVVPTATPSVTLDNIPQGYTDLVLVVAGKSTNDGSLMVRFNSDSGSNYSTTYLYGTGSGSGTSGRASNDTYIVAMGRVGVNQGTSIVNFQNYSNTTTNKTVIGRGANADVITIAATGLWRSTAAITSMTLYIEGLYNFSVGSTFTLYGIAAEGALAKATGGAIYSDSQYWYHLFPATGTFTPSQAISADVLLLAGGGGGGSNGGGGGGAGGLRVVSSQSFSSGVAYTCTIGSGGSGGTGGSSNGTAGTASSVSGSGFSTISASGGGYGATQGVSGGSGGSGGGAGKNLGPVGGSGNSGGYSPVEGYAGGTSGSSLGAAGGGGAGAVGSSSSGSNGAAGGAGNTSLTTWFSALGIGINSSIAGGGGGGSDNTGGSATGGGGAGGNTNGNGTAALANTGGGGGGGGTGSSAGNGAAGGSGIVIVRYAK